MSGRIACAHYTGLIFSPSSQLRSEVETLNGQLDKVNLARSIAESKLSDFDRYKAMIELEITEMLARHKSLMTERVARCARVRGSWEEGRGSWEERVGGRGRRG